MPNPKRRHSAMRRDKSMNQENNNLLPCLNKHIPEWANDEETIKEECKKMSLNQNEVNNFFGEHL